ncbi:hypothetical protein CSA17_04280 [bacterium DOLJORAL78_65_58]|nr:MAG: hypothetical protein CSB20_11790 [bacterium DOLZORAL124_64_63]PIE76047.1 MAG: hypothetical protein CSA17_04280 [bacterium DOLJORAL78_65_58]
MSDRQDKRPDKHPDKYPDNPLGDRRRPSTRRPAKKSKKRGFPWGKLALLIVVVFLGAGGYWYWDRMVRSTGPEVEEEFLTTGAEAVPRMGDRAVVLVYPEWDATGYVTEERQIASRDRAGEDLLNLMRQLCGGPRVSGSVSPFPVGTKALGAFFDPEDQSVVLDFSPELVTGHPGGSAAEAATLTSILRTVALNFPGTRRCTILVDGAQVETLAGHLVLDRSFDPQRWL